MGNSKAKTKTAKAKKTKAKKAKKAVNKTAEKANKKATLMVRKTMEKAQKQIVTAAKAKASTKKGAVLDQYASSYASTGKGAVLDQYAHYTGASFSTGHSFGWEDHEAFEHDKVAYTSAAHHAAEIDDHAFSSSYSSTRH